jgi:START domain
MKILCSLILILVSSASAIGQADCELRKNMDSIKVYTCKAGQSKFKAVRATFTVLATYSEMVGMLLDIEKYPQWQYKTSSTKVLKQVSSSELIYYAEVEAPWPVSNRDVIIQMKVTQDPVTKWVTVTGNSVPDYVPKKNHLVRVRASHSTWTLKSIRKSVIQAEYNIQINPGGSVPAWLINIFAAEGPYQTFRTLRENIHAHKKNERIMDFIKD